jgi:hypothetical protein
VIELLYIATTLAVGLLAGALLTEGCILVPYWRKMAPEDFFRLHGSIGLNLFRYFAPLTTIAVVLSVILGASDIVANSANPAIRASTILCVTALAVFFLYFKKANQKFAEHSIPDSALPIELRRWAAWHWFRTGLIIAAFVCLIASPLI